jgi:hypothetical protein
MEPALSCPVALPSLGPNGRMQASAAATHSATLLGAMHGLAATTECSRSPSLQLTPSHVQSAGIVRGALWDAVFENDELYPSLASMNGSCSGTSRPSHTEDGDALLNELRGSQLWHRPQAIDLIEAGSDKWEQLSQVHVLLFSTGAGDSQEGIYSLRATAGQDSLPRETVIVFEDCEDAVRCASTPLLDLGSRSVSATNPHVPLRVPDPPLPRSPPHPPHPPPRPAPTRYANLLEDAMPHLPQVCTLSAEELVSFCLERGYGCRLERSGTLLMPPILSVGMTDWELSNRLRSGAFSVLEIEPSGASTSSSSLPSSPDNSPSLGLSSESRLQFQLQQDLDQEEEAELQQVELELELGPMVDAASCSPASLSFVDLGESDHMVGIDDDMHLHPLSTESFDDLETIKSRLESLINLPSGDK